jgi:hypothetical protein
MGDLNDRRDRDARQRPARQRLLLTGAVAVGEAATIVLLAVHVVLAPMHLEESPYVGELFLIAALVLLVVAIGLVGPRRRAAWILGALVCLGMATAYVASRTVGLPLGYHESWRDAWGTVCLVLEAMYLVSMAAWFAAVRGTHVRPVRGYRSTSARAGDLDEQPLEVPRNRVVRRS